MACTPRRKSGYDDDGMPLFTPGYMIRATGDVREVSFTALKEKAAVSEIFVLGVKDIERYPATTTFCLYRAWGEVYDFDYEMEHRSHKLLRTGFSFGGARIPLRGIRITEECISCGECWERCTFKAIVQQGERFVVDHSKCDVCGDCYTICPAGAVEFIVEDSAE